MEKIVVDQKQDFTARRWLASCVLESDDEDELDELLIKELVEVGDTDFRSASNPAFKVPCGGRLTIRCW